MGSVADRLTFFSAIPVVGFVQKVNHLLYVAILVAVAKEIRTRACDDGAGSDSMVRHSSEDAVGKHVSTGARRPKATTRNCTKSEEHELMDNEK